MPTLIKFQDRSMPIHMARKIIHMHVLSVWMSKCSLILVATAAKCTCGANGRDLVLKPGA